MAVDLIFRFAFLFYCTTVGVIFVWLPWTSGWSVIVSHVPLLGSGLLESPLLRGSLSGFGLIHLIWVANDLEDLLRPYDPLHGEFHGEEDT